MNKMSEIGERVRAVALAVLVLLFMSCGSTQKKSDGSQVPIRPDYVETILHGLEAIDDMLADKGHPSAELMNETMEGMGEPELTNHEVDEMYEHASATWSAFCSLCREKKFREAYDFYYNEDHKADFLLHLVSSDSQFVFYRNVLLPLDVTFDKDNSIQKYVSNLDFNLFMTSSVIEMSDGEFIPPHYADLIIACFKENLRLGNYERAREIVNEHVRYAILNFDGGTDEEADELVKKMLEEIDAEERGN